MRTPAFSTIAYWVSNWLSASTCLLRTIAAVCAPSPATTICTSRAGSRPAAATWARATTTPAEARLVTPMDLPRSSLGLWIGLSAGTAMP